LHGRPLAAWPARQRAQQLAWLGQSEAAGDDLTVWDVALLGRLPHQPWLGRPSARDWAAVEDALRATNAKFIRRFAFIEAELAKDDRTPDQSDLAEMDSLWDAAKAAERS
jgi:ABC-type cobalamin/Fe3+-siderophores transport system ATPase subunit